VGGINDFLGVMKGLGNSLVDDKKLFKINPKIFLKDLNGIFSFFFRLQWNPIAPSKTRKICPFMSIRKSID
jgi:hypothetical protein